MSGELIDETLANMLACADREGDDANEWTRASVRMLVDEVRRLKRELEHSTAIVNGMEVRDVAIREVERGRIVRWLRKFGEQQFPAQWLAEHVEKGAHSGS